MVSLNTEPLHRPLERAHVAGEPGPMTVINEAERRPVKERRWRSTVDSIKTRRDDNSIAETRGLPPPRREIELAGSAAGDAGDLY